MSADIVVLPELGDPSWVAWQAGHITAIARTNRSGAAGFKTRERLLYQALQAGFNQTLDRWHSWEWVDSIGGVITIDRYTPWDHPYLGVLQDATFESVPRTHQELLEQALAETESILRRIA